VMARVDEWRMASSEWLVGQFEGLEARAKAEMAAEGYEATAVTLHHHLDMRYVGQSHELTVEYNTAADPLERFHAAHEARYGYRQSGAVMEIVTVRVTAVATIAPPQIPAQSLQAAAADTAVIGEKMVWFARQPHATRLYDRERLQPGHRFSGPAIVFQYDTTSVIPPGWQFAVDAFGNLVGRLETGD
jgi:N-methylhydantoinase A